MGKVVRLPAVLALTLLASCLPDTVLLSYRYAEGTELVYVMSVEARSSWDMSDGTSGSGSYSASFAVTETVGEVDEQGGLIEVVMRPTEVTERGLPSPGRGIRAFTVRVAPDGTVVRVLRVNGVPAVDLDPEEIAVIGTFRPPLPHEDVALGDTWSARREVGSDHSLQQIALKGRLGALGVDAAGDYARIVLTGTGPVVWTTELPQGRANLTGDASVRSRATVGIGVGDLRTAATAISGDLEIRIVPEGVGVPITGRLTLDLRIAVRPQDS